MRVDLYGHVSARTTDVSQLVAATLSVDFSPNECPQRRTTYYRAYWRLVDDLTVHANTFDLDGTLIEPEFPDFPTLVYVAGANEATERLLDDVPGLTLLRTESL